METKTLRPAESPNKLAVDHAVTMIGMQNDEAGVNQWLESVAEDAKKGLFTQEELEQVRQAASDKLSALPPAESPNKLAVDHAVTMIGMQNDEAGVNQWLESVAEDAKKGLFTQEELEQVRQAASDKLNTFS